MSSKDLPAGTLKEKQIQLAKAVPRENYELRKLPPGGELREACLKCCFFSPDSAPCFWLGKSFDCSDGPSYFTKASVPQQLRDYDALRAIKRIMKETTSHD